ncbi:UDP-glucose 4-epimerase GalE [Myxococcota bacterium]
MEVLVTGGAGYVGCHAARLLVESGHEVVIVDNLSRGHRHAAGGLPLIVSDIGDRVVMVEALRTHRIEVVVHFAAFAYVGESVQRPGMYFRNNVVQTLGLLEAMAEVGVRQLVFSSTCATYGVPKEVPIGEDHPQHPVNPYGDSKLFVERMLQAFERAHGLRWMALRYFNAAGAHPDGTIGELHDPETHLVPLTINAALGRRPNTRIFGTDYPTPDGTAIRDYVHVQDLARAHVLAVDHLAASRPSMALNLGTGKGVSVAQLISTVERVSGTRIERVMAPRREGDPPELVADARLAREVLGWQPAYPAIETIVEDALRYHRLVRNAPRC